VTLYEYLKDTCRLVELCAALTPVVIMIQLPPLPYEYPRGPVIRGYVTWSSVSEQGSKTSIGVQLAGGGRLSRSLVSEW
jgi:hypothetical protein